MIKKKRVKERETERVCKERNIREVSVRKELCFNKNAVVDDDDGVGKRISSNNNNNNAKNLRKRNILDVNQIVKKLRDTIRNNYSKYFINY